MLSSLLILFLVCHITHKSDIEAARILFVPPMMGPSHRQYLVDWADRLAQRGHDVLIWAPAASYDLLKLNTKFAAVKAAYIELSDKRLRENIKSRRGFRRMFWNNTIDINGHTAASIASIFTALPVCEALVYNYSDKLDEILKPHWDIVFIDELYNSCGHLISTLLNVSVRATVEAGFLTNAVSFYNNIPFFPSFVRSWGTKHPISDRMSFGYRVYNTLHYIQSLVIERMTMFLVTYRLQKRYRGIPNLETSRMNTARIFLPWDQMLSFPRPLTHNVVPTGYLQTSNFRMPEEIQRRINAAKNGVILVTMGRMPTWSDAPVALANAFIKALSSIPDSFAVLFQFHNETTPAMPTHVYIAKWFPQRLILDHPKTVVFVTHSGTHGTREAVYSGVPMVCIPMLSDQYDAAVSVSARNVAIQLDKAELTADLLLKSILTVATDQRYAKNMQRLSFMAKSGQLLPGIQNAVFYTEQLFRQTKRTQIMQGQMQRLNFFQLYCSDVILCLAAVTILFLLLVFQYG